MRMSGVKRPREASPELQPGLGQTNKSWGFLELPEGVVSNILSHLDSRSHSSLEATCQATRALYSGVPHASKLSLGDAAAKDAVIRKCGGSVEAADRWRQYTWRQRLLIEETTSQFDMLRCKDSEFKFSPVADNPGLVALRLDGIGPKMAVSRESTKDRRVLRWHMELIGNNAVECGVVPSSLQDIAKALHKCQSAENGSNDRPTGLSSAITVGSMLPIRVPLMKNSTIEVLVWGSRLEFMITQPESGMEMTWVNSVTVPKPYKGPRHFRFEMEAAVQTDMKLAITCWARAEFHMSSSFVPSEDGKGNKGSIEEDQPQATTSVTQASVNMVHAAHPRGSLGDHFKPVSQ